MPEQGEAYTTPQISVIIAVLNRASCIEKAIQSVLNQTYQNFELLIIDGGSDDGTTDIIGKFKDRIAYWVSEHDNGIFDAWNKAIPYAKGKWFSFIGSDDELYPDAFDAYMSFIESHTDEEFDFISARYHIVSPTDKITGMVRSAWSWPKFAHFMNVTHISSLHNRKMFEKHGLFTTRYKYSSDYEFLLRSGPDLKAGFIPTPLFKSSYSGGSSSFTTLIDDFRIKSAFRYQPLILSLLTFIADSVFWSAQRVLRLFNITPGIRHKLYSALFKNQTKSGHLC